MTSIHETGCGCGDGCGCGSDGRVELSSRLRHRLRSLRLSWLEGDLLDAGVIAGLSQEEGRVTVTLDPTGARLGSERDELTRLVREALSSDPRVEKVRVQWRLPRSEPPPPGAPATESRNAAGVVQPPEPGAADRSSRSMTPLQAELLEEGVLPEPDALGRSREGPRIAEAAGYRDGGPPPLPGPTGSGSHERYERDVPVFQWEIDPLEAERPVGEADVDRDGWEHRIWWQVHPQGLAYASIQAMPESDPGVPTRHPLGRAVAVNLVYDLERDAIVAVYGTAGDFRPFVSVFLEVFTPPAGLLENEADDGEERNGRRRGREQTDDEPEETE